MIQQSIIRAVENDILDACIEAYLDDCRMAMHSPNTITNYADKLGKYHWWCVEHRVPLDPREHTRETMRMFITYLQQAPLRWVSIDDAPTARAQAPLKPGSIMAYRRALSAFFNWLVGVEELIDVSPMVGIPKARVREEKPDPFSGAEMARLVAALRPGDQSELAMRNRAILGVLLDTGVRVSELCAISTDDIEIVTGELAIPYGKGGKHRRLRMGSVARRAVRKYWTMHRRTYGRGPLFLSIRGEALTRSGVTQMLEKLGARAGVSPCNPHRFRHTFAVQAIRAGTSQFHLQAMLGHADLEMVSRYVKLAEDDVRLASGHVSPLDQWKLKL